MTQKAYLGTIGYLKSQLMTSSALSDMYNEETFKPGVIAPNSQIVGTFVGAAWYGSNDLSKTVLVEPDVVTLTKGNYLYLCGTNKTSNQVQLNCYNKYSRLVTKMKFSSRPTSNSSGVLIYRTRYIGYTASNTANETAYIGPSGLGLRTSSYNANTGNSTYNYRGAVQFPLDTWIYIFMGNCVGSTTKVHVGYSLDGKLWKTSYSAQSGSLPSNFCKIYAPVTCQIDLTATRYEIANKIVYGNDTVGVKLPDLPSTQVTQF